MDEGPILIRLQLGQQLRELRLASGKTLDDIEYADIMGKSKLYNIEAGRQPRPSWPEIQELARLYGAADQHVRELVRMAQASLQSGWWVPFEIPKQFQPYLDLEDAAKKLRFFEVEYVNGLFQTENCMRAIQRAGGIPLAEVQPHIDFRNQRNKRFWSRDPIPLVELIMSEAVLRHLAAEQNLWTEQIEQLRRLGEKPQISIHVLPFSAGFRPQTGGSFTLMEFKPNVYPEVVYVESRAQCHYHERRPVVAMYNEIYYELLDVVVPLEEFEL